MQHPTPQARVAECVFCNHVYPWTNIKRIAPHTGRVLCAACDTRLSPAFRAIARQPALYGVQERL